MGWITTRELARLERERENAIRRAEAAEERLAAERQRHDWLALQLVSRVVTKHGGYGLDEVKAEPPAPHPRGFTHEPDDMDMAKLEFYKQCARDAGVEDPDSDAQRRWEAEMRGEELPIEYDN